MIKALTYNNQREISDIQKVLNAINTKIQEIEPSDESNLHEIIEKLKI